MKKINLLFLLLFACCGSLLYAQTDDEDNKPGKEDYVKPTMPDFYKKIDNCAPAPVKTQYFIAFKSGIDGFIEFNAQIRGEVSFQMRGDRNRQKAIKENNVFVMPNLRSNTEYEIFAPDACGKLELVKVLTTNMKSISENGFHASPELFKLLEDFPKLGRRTPFNKYLDEVENVSLYERIAFFQNYALNGRLLKKGANPMRFTIGTGGDGGGGGGGDDDDDLPNECMCATIYMSQVANPGVLIGNPIGNITEEVSNQPDTPLSGNGGSWWWHNYSAGAAKYQQVYSDGWKARRNQEMSASYSTLNADGVGMTTNHSSLTYNYFCNNPAQPYSDECNSCERNLTIHYKYDTKLNSYAKLHTGGGGSKKSYSQVEDFCVVTLRQGLNPNDIEVLDAGDARLSSTCNQDVNPQFWVSILNVATVVGQAALAGTVTSQTITSLQEGIEGVMSEPYATYELCEGAGILSQALAAGSKEVILRPNKVIRVDMVSFSNLETGGQRSWYTHAGIQSDFYLTGLISGGYKEGVEPAFCCQKQMGNWVLASAGGPASEENLRTDVGQHFVATDYINPYIWNFPTGGGNVPQIPGDYGFQEVDLIDCSNIQEDPNEPPTSPNDPKYPKGDKRIGND